MTGPEANGTEAPRLPKVKGQRGERAGVARSEPLAQVMMSPFVSSSPAAGSVLMAESLEPALDSVSPSLCPSPTHTLSVCLSLKNKHQKLF